MATKWPSRASWRATARPMPRDAPVTRAIGLSIRGEVFTRRLFFAREHQPTRDRRLPGLVEHPEAQADGSAIVQGAFFGDVALQPHRIADLDRTQEAYVIQPG